MDLTGRVALVTGGSGDLGNAIARALASAGADVAATYVGNEPGATATCEAVEKQGRRTCRIQLDQTDPESARAAVAAAVSRLGRLDVLVNNAAWNIGIPFPDLDGLTDAVWERMWKTNLLGPFQLARAAAPHMRAQGAGRIVNIASIAGLMPSGSSLAYATTKAALIHLTRCLAVALAPDITVNCVAPGLIEGTRMARRLPPEVAEQARQRAVLRRATSGEDVASQVVAFCRADTVTGQVVPVDAGIHFH
ncbi:MAG: SDR family oxidoreductase [Candidatus Rokubacteria bacterium]|nr:SDR family oxidoreductase [Candidatus Rokubacteria bacterium]